MDKLSIHSINKAVENVPCEKSVRYHLSKMDLDTLQESQLKIFTYSNDQSLVPGKSYRFAIDFTDDPYCGEIIEANKEDVIKSKMKKSTTDLLLVSFALPYDKRPTADLAVFPVKKGVSKVGYLRKFLAIINETQVNIEIL